jgi:hypothetical protein
MRASDLLISIPFPTRHPDPERSEGEGPHAVGSVITFLQGEGPHAMGSVITCVAKGRDLMQWVA